MSRESYYTDSIIPDVEKLIFMGATDPMIAQYFEISLGTLRKWRAKYPALDKVMKRAKDVADDTVEHCLYHRATGYTVEETKVFCHNGEIITHTVEKHYPPDESAIRLWLTNRRPDKWRVKNEVTGAGGEPLVPEMSDTELARKIAFILTEEERKLRH